MKFLKTVSLDTKRSALTTECKGGIINNKNVATSSVTRTKGVPYCHLDLTEENEGEIIASGKAIVWAKRNLRDEWEFQGIIPALLHKAIGAGPRPLNWVMALINKIPVDNMDEFIGQGDDRLYEYLERIIPDFDRNAEYGSFHQRPVEEYRDAAGEKKSTFTCFLFSWESKTEEQIIRAFSYHNKSVITEPMAVA